MGLSCMVNYRVIFSPMAFQLYTNRVNIGMFNISSGFFEIQKLKKMTVFAIQARFFCKKWLVRGLRQKPLLGISPNLVYICFPPSFRHLLIMGDLDLHLQGHLALKHSKSGHFGLVRTISQNVLHGISPNLHRICILPSFQHLLNMGDHLGQKY